ncbi:MAG TPA: FMN-dependent NADH-azoreductase [Caulobacteraceae bacterium]|jgi:FMN-dependent NADH-azoreductase|nr:FMN-dependent NADH-azoreductase [Caulobacteraceae bacterium]
MNLLHLDASVLGNHSVSRQVSAAIVARLRAADPTLDVTYRDLAAAPLPHLSGLHLAAGQGAAVPTHIQEEHLAAQAALSEFLAADVVVIGAPMYNFTLPSQLKAWIDRILIAGQTFRYTAAGPEGLAGGKRVIVALSRGNVYGGANAAYEHLESYLRTVFGFIGVTNLEFIAADGIQLGPEHRERALKGALDAAGQLRAA